jgi:TatD DNase family protein
MIDTHSHLYLPDFEEDLQAVINRCKSVGIEKVYLPAIDSSTHDSMMALAAAQPGWCIPMMGLHPCYVTDDYQQEMSLVESWLAKQPFAAIGEIGLDFYHSTEFKQEQIDVFVWQINLAMQYDLPIVIHSRSSMDECIKLIAEHGKGKIKGIFHCFGGDERQARKIIDLGFMLGIGGVVTYKNAGLAKLIETLPLDALVLETDSPYLTPVPFRGKRNESSYLTYVAAKIAEMKGITIEEVALATTNNSKKIFPL